MSFPLHARYAHPDAGWDADREAAAKVLTVGEVYTIRQLEVGQSTSHLTFQEVPGQFNTVLFDPVGGWQEDLDEALAPRILTGPLTADGSGPLLDPDCRDGKHTSCLGDPCECECHTSGTDGVRP